MAVNVGIGKTPHIMYRKEKIERKRPGHHSHFQGKHPLEPKLPTGLHLLHYHKTYKCQVADL
jgi:hypothetical protein